MNAYLKNSRTGEDTEYTTLFTLEKGEDSFIVTYDCKKSEMYSCAEGYNSPIYAGDVCEIFISIGDDIMKYYEIEVAPNNSVFFKLVENLGDRRIPTPQENTLTTSITKTADGYICKMIIPYASVSYDKDKGAYFNAYRIETDGGERDKHLLALNPTMCDSFHTPKSFIKL